MTLPTWEQPAWDRPVAAGALALAVAAFSSAVRADAAPPPPPARSGGRSLGAGHADPSGTGRPVTDQWSSRAWLSTSDAVRMPQNSNPYRWPATWASMAISVPAAPSGRTRPGTRRHCRGGDDPGQGDGDGVQRPHPQALEPEVALDGGQLDHPEHRPVVLPVVHEPLDHRHRGVPAGRLRPVPVHQAGEHPRPFDQLLGQHGDRGLDVLEVLVEGGGRGPGLPGDVDHLDRPPRCGHQQLGRALQQALAGGPTPLTGHPAVRGGDQLRDRRPWRTVVGIGMAAIADGAGVTRGEPVSRRRSGQRAGRTGRRETWPRNPWRVG